MRNTGDGTTPAAADVASTRAICLVLSALQDVPRSVHLPEASLARVCGYALRAVRGGASDAVALTDVRTVVKGLLATPAEATTGSETPGARVIDLAAFRARTCGESPALEQLTTFGGRAPRRAGGAMLTCPACGGAVDALYLIDRATDLTEGVGLGIASTVGTLRRRHAYKMRHLTQILSGACSVDCERALERRHGLAEAAENKRRGAERAKRTRRRKARTARRCAS